MTHKLTVYEVKDHGKVNWVVSCLSCQWETAEFYSRASAEARATHPCELEAVSEAGRKRRERRLRAA